MSDRALGVGIAVLAGAAHGHVAAALPDAPVPARSRAAARGQGRATTPVRVMRIGSKIFIVGAIPIVIAAAIALAAILLLQEANRARSGAALAGTVFRTLLTAVMARNDYLHDAPTVRFIHQRRFFEVTAQAHDDLVRLRALQPARDASTLSTEATLAQYVEDMKKLVRVTADNDGKIEVMRDRATALIALTDQARERQHASNADIVRSLAEGDVRLRAARDIMDAAYATRMATAAIEGDLLDLEGSATATDPQVAARRLAFDGTRLRQVTADLVVRLKARGDDQAATAAAIDQGALSRLAGLSNPVKAPADVSADGRGAVQDVAQWSERLLKIFSAEYRSFHEEAAQLLTYSVQAHDTELATQNIAIETLKLSNASGGALARREEAAARALLASSRGLIDTLAALPISPLIQSEMLDAFGKWREGLQTATVGIKQQNDLMSDMDGASAAMIRAARLLDDTFSGNAESTARSIRVILLVGAATGLLLGGGAALFVARAITKPLARLQSRMVEMAEHQDDGLIEDGGKRDELGDIARATNVFLVEIARRERALRSAKERADAALETLRRTQAELIQAEKLASLGQLVAGVAHEINTPIGIALTTSTVVEEETARFRAAIAEGRISRGALDRLVERVAEGAGFLTANLTRAAELIQSFKHVAADQVSGERREFDVRGYLHQLLTSLGPMLRKAGHSATMECPDDLLMDSHPGALGQVITNLVVNASLHGYGQGEAGLIAVTVSPADGDAIRIVVGDDGRGIATDKQAKVFDPFFTTRRSQGSTGLGLHIVFNLVTSTLGGRIELDSRPGCGTRFVIELPRRPAVPGALPLEQEVPA